MVVAFVPTPSFPQYYVPPIGFGIGLVILLYAQLELGERAGVGSFLYAAMLIAFVAGASRLAADLTKLGTRSEEHTSELQSLMRISYAVFCLKKKNTTTNMQSRLNSIQSQ